MDDIAERLEQIRAERGWSAREFSRLAGLDEKQFSKIQERGGRRASAETIAAFAKAAGVRLDWLVSGEGPRDSAAHPEPTTVLRYEGPPRYRNRSVALEAIRAELHPETAARVERGEGMVFNAHRDPEVSEWIQAILIMDRKIRIEQESPEAAAAELERDRAETARLAAANEAGRQRLRELGVDAPRAEELPPPPPKLRKKREEK